MSKLYLIGLYNEQCFSLLSNMQIWKKFILSIHLDLKICECVGLLGHLKEYCFLHVLFFKQSERGKAQSNKAETAVSAQVRHKSLCPHIRFEYVITVFNQICHLPTIVHLRTIPHFITCRNVNSEKGRTTSVISQTSVIPVNRSVEVT